MLKKLVDPTIALEGLCIIIKGKDKLEFFNNFFQIPMHFIYTREKEKGLFQISPSLADKISPFKSSEGGGRRRTVFPSKVTCPIFNI